jgi:hypothetical protein
VGDFVSSQWCTCRFGISPAPSEEWVYGDFHPMIADFLDPRYFADIKQIIFAAESCICMVPKCDIRVGCAAGCGVGIARVMDVAIVRRLVRLAQW